MELELLGLPYLNKIPNLELDNEDHFKVECYRQDEDLVVKYKENNITELLQDDDFVYINNALYDFEKDYYDDFHDL
jgi:hypothetical protein